MSAAVRGLFASKKTQIGDYCAPPVVRVAFGVAAGSVETLAL